jgi:hypothetical protein
MIREIAKKITGPTTNDQPARSPWTSHSTLHPTGNPFRPEPADITFGPRTEGYQSGESLAEKQKARIALAPRNQESENRQVNFSTKSWALPIRPGRAGQAIGSASHTVTGMLQ